jgi:hypothetical protein
MAETWRVLTWRWLAKSTARDEGIACSDGC